MDFVNPFIYFAVKFIQLSLIKSDLGEVSPFIGKTGVR